MTFRYGNWPFPTGVPAYLSWIRSPLQVGKDKQWRMKVIFSAQNGCHREVLYPWGILPSLRLGRVYVNGQISEAGPIGNEQSVVLGRHATCRVLSADFLRNELLDGVRAYKKEALWERCVCIEDGQYRLWVPCIEILRSFFAINKQMSYLLLEPGGLTKICNTGIEDGIAHLHFTEEIPVSALNNILAVRVAAILHDPEWWNCWQEVWIRSIKNSGAPTVYSQIICHPPVLSNSEWCIRGIPSQNGFFVLEVLGITIKTNAPFSEVVFTHPKLIIPLKGEQTSGDGSGKSTGGCGKDGRRRSIEGEKEVAGENPSDLPNPILLPVAVSRVSFGNKLRVSSQRSIGKPKKGRSGGSGRPKRDPRDLRTGGKGPIFVSMNDEAGTGSLPAAEFQPIEILTSIPYGLKPFIAAVTEVPMSKIGCSIESVPDASPLSKLGETKRSFALVHVISWRRSGYILETDWSDGHRVSTLIFVPPRGKGSLEVARQLLVECLGNGGHWSLETLKRDLVEKYELAKHRSCSSYQWGVRLYFKLPLNVTLECENGQKA